MFVCLFSLLFFLSELVVAVTVVFVVVVVVAAVVVDVVFIAHVVTLCILGQMLSLKQVLMCKCNGILR